MVRFIMVSVVLTFAFLIAIPAIQISALFKNTAVDTVSVANVEANEPSVIAETESIAEELNAIDTAAGDVMDTDITSEEEGYGLYFVPTQHESFQ